MTGLSKRPYSLGLRLSWLFAAQTFLGLGLASASIYTVMYFYLNDKAGAELSQKADLVKHLISEAERTGDVPTMQHKLDEFFTSHRDLRVILRDAAGAEIYVTPGSWPPSLMVHASNFTLQMEGSSKSLIRAQISMDRTDDAQLLAGLAIALAFTTLLGVVVVSAAGFWAVRRSLSPLRGLAQQTRTLDVDPPGRRLALARPVQELQPWIDQVNNLLTRTEGAYRQLEGFSADVAHELRTPLATLIGQTEVELCKVRSADALRETMTSNLEELHRLSGIVNDMLFLSRADRGVKISQLACASLAVEARHVIEYFEGALLERGLASIVSGDAQILFDKGLMRRAISNLLSNAMRYAAPASTICIEIAVHLHGVSLAVKNQGLALPQAAVPRLFDRFFRVQTSREGGSENHGLGLSIVAAIAQMHGGTVFAQSEGGVTSIGLVLPNGRSPMGNS
jgi:two-component system heavy metal sensor histidine kinase CusS